MTLKPRRTRNGTTLLEILIATAIMLVAIAALGTHAAVGMRAARRVQLESMSTILCQSVLDELVATRQVQSTSRAESVRGHDDWRYSAEVSAIAGHSQADRVEHLRQLYHFVVSTWKSGPSASDSKTSLELIVRKPERAVPDAAKSAYESVFKSTIGGQR